MIEVFLDLDGVLTDFVGAALKAHDRCLDDLEPGNWDITKVLGIGPTHFWSKCNGHDFWANLEWTWDGKDILRHLETIYGQKNICILTSPTIDPESASGKLEWIQKNIPDYRRQYFIGPPKHFCAGPNKLLFDDSDSNIDKFIKNGGKGILIPRLWNSGNGVDALGHLERYHNE